MLTNSSKGVNRHSALSTVLNALADNGITPHDGDIVAVTESVAVSYTHLTLPTT